MIKRLINLSNLHSFFLFGPRGVGKSTLLKEQFAGVNTLYIDLLNPQELDRFLLKPSLLSEQIADLPAEGEFFVVIDEVQRAPELLNVVHIEIEAHSRSQMKITTERPSKRKVYFLMTGSSARKLRRGRANLLAGRAFLYYLHGISFFEAAASLNEHLTWGGLPKILTTTEVQEKKEHLRAYTHVYLVEEIAQEQIVRQLLPFRRFIEVAAQMNGQIVNYKQIADDIGVSPVTVQSYFQILEDTLICFRLDSFHHSIRKRFRANPKYYFFDIGVKRSFANQLEVPHHPQTYEYGKTFEHFFILECLKLNEYLRKDYRFSYLKTADNTEIDLVIERPGQLTALVEVKSKNSVTEKDLRHLKNIMKDLPKSEAFCLSQDETNRVVDGVQVLEWKEGLRRLGFE